MKRVPNTAHARTVTVESVDLDGRRRTFTLVRPTAARAHPPLLLMFHGSNQSGPGFRSFTGQAFDRLADSGVFVAYLDGYAKHWNDARRSITFAARREQIDDVAFARAVVDDLVATHGVDRTRVFAAGFSNGGQMAIRLAHEIPGELAGIAVIAATQPAPENLDIQPAEPTPLPTLLIHGTRDPLVPYHGGTASMWGFRPRGRGLSAPDTAAYFAERNRITTAPRTTSVADRIERTSWTQDGRPPVALLTVTGGGHTVPGPRRAPFVMGHTSRAIDSATVIGAFLGLDGPATSGPDS